MALGTLKSDAMERLFPRDPAVCGILPYAENAIHAENTK